MAHKHNDEARWKSAHTPSPIRDSSSKEPPPQGRAHISLGGGQSWSPKDMPFPLPPRVPEGEADIVYWTQSLPGLPLDGRELARFLELG